MFSPNIKKVIMVRDRLHRVVAFKQSYEKHSCFAQAMDTGNGKKNWPQLAIRQISPNPVTCRCAYDIFTSVQLTVNASEHALFTLGV